MRVDLMEHMERFEVTFYQLLNQLKKMKLDVSVEQLDDDIINYDSISYKKYKTLYYAILEVERMRHGFAYSPAPVRRYRQKIKYLTLWSNKGHICNYGGESNRRHKNTEYFH